MLPAKTLWSDPFRAGIGRFSQRSDLAALTLVLVFGAFANAAGMVAPVVAWQDRLSAAWGTPPRWLTISLFYLIAIIGLPMLCVSLVTLVAKAWGKVPQSFFSLAARNSFSLIPIGFSMWLAHYGFHLLTSYASVIPTSQRFIADLGLPIAGNPLWQCACCQSVGDWLPRLEIVMLDCGLLLSLYTGWRIAEETAQPSATRAFKAFVPWGLLMLLLFCLGVWIVLQPMEMRGTLPIGG